MQNLDTLEKKKASYVLVRAKIVTGSVNCKNIRRPSIPTSVFSIPMCSFSDGEFVLEEEEGADLPETFPATAIKTSRPPSVENGLPNQPKEADESKTDEPMKNIDKEEQVSPEPSVSEGLSASEQDMSVEIEGGSSRGDFASSSDGLSGLGSPRESEEGDNPVIKGVVSIRDALAQMSLKDISIKDTLETVDLEVYTEKGSSFSARNDTALGSKEMDAGRSNEPNGSSVQYITSEIISTASLSNVRPSENTTSPFLLPPSPHVPTLDPSCNDSSLPRTPSQGSPVTPRTPSQSSITHHTPSQISAHTPSPSSAITPLTTLQIAALSPHTPSHSTTFSPHTPSSPAPSSQESLFSPLSSGMCTPDVDGAESDSRTRVGLKFASLEMNEPVLVEISWAESPGDFVVSSQRFRR